MSTMGKCKCSSSKIFWTVPTGVIMKNNC
jgi:hypothetical protein